jgi:hypothetical protein
MKDNDKELRDYSVDQQSSEIVGRIQNLNEACYATLTKGER